MLSGFDGGRGGMDERWRAVREIFEQALALDEEARQTFLERACGQDEALRAEVERLIAADAGGDSLLDQRARDALPEATVELSIDEIATLAQTPDTPGEGPSAESQIGPYRLVRKLGEGGMGEVWLAEQQEPVRREVALKVIKPGMDSRQIVARFEAERQALARMDHPAIAKVHEAGASPLGRPYFVMEYVQGLPITEYCDRERLSNRQRLELFRQLCDGVQHAHQKAVIHRDLKPSNVLVSEHDGKPHVKIIDFGVAKAIQQPLTARSLFTELGAILGTPEYMSPEQADPGTDDIDTRSDVYSLGVLLYELLIGALPFDSRELRAAGLEAIVRKIREEEPARPSARLSTLQGERSTESAKRRNTSLSSLRREIAGDLDWITLRALEKDRDRRYESAAALSSDIGRYLANEAVLASPPSPGYRVGKFMRRHRLGVAIVAAALLVLVGFATTMSVQAGRIAAERDRANVEARSKDEVARFLKELFEVSDPNRARGSSITVRELLDRGVDRIGQVLTTQPEIGAELLDTMGDVYVNLGLYEEAEPLFVRALGERQRILGDEHPDTLAAAYDRARVHYHLGRYEEARSAYLEMIATQRRVLGTEHARTLTTIDALAEVHRKQGHYTEARELLLQNIESWKRVVGEDHPNTLRAMGQLGTLARIEGQYTESEAMLQAVVEGRRRTLGSDHPHLTQSMMDLAIVYSLQRRFEEAEALYLEVLDSHRRVVGDDHPQTIATMINLGILYDFMRRADEAAEVLEDAVERAVRTRGEGHSQTMDARQNLGNAYVRQRRYADAATIFNLLLESRIEKFGIDHPDTLKLMHSLASARNRQGRLTEAEALFRDALKRQRRVHGDTHVEVIRTAGQLGHLLWQQGRVSESAALFELRLEGSRTTYGEEHPSTLTDMNNLGGVLVESGRVQEARELLEEALERRLRVLGETHAHIGYSYYHLAMLAAVDGDPDLALDHLRRALELGWAEQKIHTTSTFDSLRGDAEFEALAGRIPAP